MRRRLYVEAHAPAAVCRSCGVKFAAQRVACPRCGAPTAEPLAGPAARGGSTVPRVPRGRSGAAAAALVLGVGGLLAWPSTKAVAPRPSADHPAPVTLTGASIAPQPGGMLVDRSRPPAEPSRTAFLDAEPAGRLAFREGRLEDALAKFEEALRGNPDDAYALNNAGQALVRLERADEAVPLLERAAQGAPGSWEVRFNLARALGEAGRWADAAAEYRRAAELWPDGVPITYNLARALEKAGDVPAAIEQYRRAVALMPDEAPFHLSLAQACERAGRTDEATQAYGQYLARLPEGEEASKVKRHLAALQQPPAAGPGGSRASS